MADHSSIEWTDATWNPITGCSIVSPGCTHCYAMKLAGTRLKHIPSREGLTKDSKAGPVWTGEVRLNEHWLDQPLKWKRPRKIFVCAHGDLFAENVPDAWIDKVFAVMALAPHHTFQVLTKRAERMREYMNGLPSKIPYLGRMPLERIHLEAAGHMEGDGGFMDALKRHGNVYSLYCSVPWPLPNVWLGVSAERQQEADERIPHLLQTPAAIRFVSAEPLLGPIEFTSIRYTDEDAEIRIDATTAEAWVENSLSGAAYSNECDGVTKLDWVIVGGESGQGARPMHPDWARSIRDQCAAAGVAFHFKQWGSWAPLGQAPAKTHQPIDRKRRWLHIDGSSRPSGDAHAIENEESDLPEPLPYSLVMEVGKKRAGRLLDGVEHNGFPVALV